MDVQNHPPALQPVTVAAAQADADLPTTTEATLTVRPNASATDQRLAMPTDAPQAVRFGSDVPSLRISTQGPDTLVVGRPADFLITLQNQSSFAARQVAVRIDLPAWVELAGQQAAVGDVQRQPAAGDSGDRLIWNVEEVAGGDAKTLSLSLVPRAGRAFDLAVDVSVRPSTSATKIAVQEPKLQLQLQGDDDALFGEPCRWTIAVHNPGTGDAHQVRLDVYSDAQKLASQQVDTVAAGTQQIVDLTLLPLQAGAQNLRVVAVADPGLSAQASAPYRVRRAQLALSLDSTGFEYAGTPTTYTVRLANVGDALASGVQVQLALPAAAKYQGGIAQAQKTSAGCDWTVDAIAPGEEQTWEVACELVQAGDCRASATARSEGAVTATAEATTIVQAAADLQLRVSDPPAPQATGAPVQWKIELTNRGTDSARDVYLVAVCPPEVNLVDVSGSAAIESGEIYFQPIKQLAPGQTVTQTVTVRATTAGCYVLRVVAQCEQPQSQLACEESTQFFERQGAPQTAAPSSSRRRTVSPEIQPLPTALPEAAPLRTASPLPMRKVTIR